MCDLHVIDPCAHLGVLQRFHKALLHNLGKIRLDTEVGKEEVGR